MTKNISRYVLVLSALIAVACTSSVPSGKVRESDDPMTLLRENPFRAGVNTCPYEWGPYADTPAPSGYKPFYISHYGRHGSRSNWDERTYQMLIGTLEKADEAALLTDNGKTLLDVTRQCLERHNGMNGRLTPRGVREHRGIAERMYGRFKSVLKGGNVRAISSTVPRCIISMTGFTDRLTELDPSMEISWDTGEEYMKYIDPHVPGEYTRAVSREAYALEKLPVDTVKFLSSFFTDPEKAKAMVGAYPFFEYSVFAVARITAAFDIDTDIFPMLPEEIIYNNWLSNNASIYLGHANSPKAGDLRMAPASATVKEIVEKAEAVIAGENVAADLRFGHDFPFTAMCSYLGLEGVGARLETAEIPQKWFGSDYTPFAANLQWIFYRGKQGDVFVKFLLNERETLIPELNAVSGPYYRWDDLKSYISKRDAHFQNAVAQYNASK